MIIGFIGTIGTGKTISSVRQLYFFYKLNYTIYSNIKLNFPYIPITYEMIKNYAKDKKAFTNKSLIFIDEITLFLDSRRSGSAKNLIITYFLLQTRKKSCSVIYTAQFFHSVDKRLRDLTDDVIECYTKKLCDCKEDCTHNKYELNKHNIRRSNGILQKNDMFKMNIFYTLYNSYEVVEIINE
jgi:hypothetical protein